MSENKGRLIQFPKADKLREEVRRLKYDTSVLIATRDEIGLIENLRIEIRYLEKYGDMEKRMLETQYEQVRLERKIAMLRDLKENNITHLHVDDIEKELDRDIEVVMARDKLDIHNKKLRDLSYVKHSCEMSDVRCDADKEQKEIVELYRRVAYDYDPKLNPNVDKRNKRLHENAVNALIRKDLYTLRLINEMFHSNDDELEGLSVWELMRTKENLEAVKQNVEETISDIKRNYPYKMKLVLEDEDRRVMYENDVEKIITGFELMIKEMHRIVKELE